MSLRYFPQIPDQIDLAPIEFLKWLGNTSIIKAGQGSSSIILLCLIHGNEPSGFYAFHDLLRKLKDKDELKKTVYFIFANVQAALHGNSFEIRFTEGQSDMNRIWTKEGINTNQNAIVSELKQFIQEKNPQLIVDFHNTTGKNPIYLITPPNINHNLLQEYSCFTTFLSEDTDLTMLISWSGQFYHSFLIECGQNTSDKSHQKAKELLEKVLIYGKAKDGELSFEKKVNVAYNPDRVVVNPAAEIEISNVNTGADIVFRKDLDDFNTNHLPLGSFLGWVNKPEMINHPKLEIINRKLLLKESATLILLTTHIPAIQKTCLGYFVNIKEHKF